MFTLVDGVTGTVIDTNESAETLLTDTLDCMWEYTEQAQCYVCCELVPGTTTGEKRPVWCMMAEKPTEPIGAVSGVVYVQWANRRRDVYRVIYHCNRESGEYLRTEVIKVK